MTRAGVYCPKCLGFRRYGKEAGPGGGLVWLDEPCDWCAEREAKAAVEVAKLEAMWAVRECAAPDCSVVFTPATSTQRFHDDACRKRTHRRSKAQRAR